MRGKQSLIRPLMRLPAVIFPGQPISLSKADAPVAESSAFDASEALLSCAWRKHDGCIAAFGPGSRIGVVMHVMFDQVLDAMEPTPPGVAHAVGGQRVRLSRIVVRGDDVINEDGSMLAEPQLGELTSLEDEELTPARRERLADEAGAARKLLELGEERGLFALESSVLDEELGGRNVCDPRCHPLWPAEGLAPEAEDELSLWLGARLPFTNELRIQMLSTLCPLRRMQDVVDALRLLCDPQRPRGAQYKYKLITSHPATDAYCRTIATPIQGPRAVVALAPPNWTNWSSSDSFPHG